MPDAEQIPVRRTGLVVLALVFLAVPVVLAVVIAVLSRGASEAPELARLSLTDEESEAQFPAPASGRIELWNVMSVRETSAHRKQDLLRYEIRVTHDGKRVAELSCNPFRASVYTKNDRSGDRLEVEHDMDDCSASVPSSGSLTVRARRVWLKKIDGVSLERTELVVRAGG